MVDSITEENFYSRAMVDAGKLFHGEYIINVNHKDIGNLEWYEKSLGFHCDEKPNLIEVDCYIDDDGMKFLVTAHIGEGKTYYKAKELLTKDEYFHLISDLVLENTEY